MIIRNSRNSMFHGSDLYKNNKHYFHKIYFLLCLDFSGIKAVKSLKNIGNPLNDNHVR
jgi:hypothetical protein